MGSPTRPRPVPGRPWIRPGEDDVVPEALLRSAEVSFSTHAERPAQRARATKSLRAPPSPAPIPREGSRRSRIGLEPFIAHTGEEKDLATRSSAPGAERRGRDSGSESDDHPRGSRLSITHLPVLQPARRPRASTAAPPKSAMVNRPFRTDAPNSIFRSTATTTPPQRLCSVTEWLTDGVRHGTRPVIRKFTHMLRRASAAPFTFVCMRRRFGCHLRVSSTLLDGLVAADLNVTGPAWLMLALGNLLITRPCTRTGNLRECCSWRRRRPPGPIRGASPTPSGSPWTFARSCSGCIWNSSPMLPRGPGDDWPLRGHCA